MLTAALATSLAVLLLASGDVLMSRAVKRLGPFEWGGLGSIFRFLGLTLRVPYFWMALMFLAGHFFLWLWVLSWAELSVVVPMTAVQYIFNAVLANLYLGERVNGMRWAGTAVIVAGVLIITMGSEA